MPYRLNPNNRRQVQTKGKNYKWVVVKTHKTVDEAMKHLAALKINVKE